MGLEQDVDDVTVLVDGPPEILTLTADGHEEFVQMPGVADRPGPLPEPPRVTKPESKKERAQGCDGGNASGP